MIFLTKTNQSIFLCDVTTELTATVLGRDNSLKKLLKSFVGIKTSYKSLQEFFCCLKKTNPHEFVGFKNLFKNHYVKTTHKTKQGCVALSAIILKYLKGLSQKVRVLSRVKFALRTSPEKTPAEKEGNNSNAPMPKLTMEDYNKLKSLVDTILNTAPEICNQSAINLAWKIYLGK